MLSTMQGLLGTGAPISADLNLIVQIAMGLALAAGAVLARRKHYRAHAVCQASVVLMNLIMIATVMWPSYREQVLTHASLRRLGRPYYFAAASHGVMGIAAELLGLYVVLAAGTRVLPARLRFRRWKVWMRAALVLWWTVILTGVGVYYVWYMAWQ